MLLQTVGALSHAPRLVLFPFHFKSVRRRFSQTSPISNFPSHDSSTYFHFEIIHRSKKSLARVGRIHTPHGVIDTPGFVPVATNATIKHLDSLTLSKETGSQLLFCNTYHLAVHPGPEVIKRAGGLHPFTKYPNPMITDSGGFQVFSLLHGPASSELKGQGRKRHGSLVRKIDESGVTFQSYRDGSDIHLTPESSVEYQKAFGADIIIPLDELPPFHASPSDLRASLERTHRWEARSLFQHLKDPQKQAMYGVIHGGVDENLRKQSTSYLTGLPFDGFGVGGSLGSGSEDMMKVIRWVKPGLPNKPIHLLGIGDRDNITNCIPEGIDTFDSCWPARVSRHGRLVKTDGGHIDVENAMFKTVQEPIDPKCDCYTFTSSEESK